MLKFLNFFSWLMLSTGIYFMYDVSWKIALGVALFVFGHQICLQLPPKKK
jgi:hypothetical protein